LGTEGDGLLAHAEHAVDLLDAEPMQDIGHQGLESHVLDPGDALSSLEVIRGAVFSSFSCIVHNYS
jgi:hypothetical protein